MTKLITGLAVSLALVTTGCGNTEEEAPPAAPTAQPAVEQAQQAAQAAQQAAQQAQQAAQQQQAAAPAPAGGSNFGTVTLNPGFTPDPHVVSGTSGGSVDAATLHTDCVGQVSAIPNHLFVAGGAFGTLRIMARSTSDTTLVVQKPDNTFVCNDDDTDTNPLVEISNAPAGTYKVYIGSYNQGENASYQLGFSEMANVNAASLPAN